MGQMSNRKPPSSQDLTDEIEQLKEDMASLKKRYAKPPTVQLEEQLAALAAVERPHPMSPEEKGSLSEEIQAFKNEISELKQEIERTEEKLAPMDSAESHSREPGRAAEDKTG